MHLSLSPWVSFRLFKSLLLSKLSNTLLSLILEWSFLSLINVCFLVQCACFKVKFELFPLVQLLFLFVYLWNNSRERTRMTNSDIFIRTHTHTHAHASLSSYHCHVYIPQICFVFARCAIFFLLSSLFHFNVVAVVILRCRWFVCLHSLSRLYALFYSWNDNNTHCWYWSSNSHTTSESSIRSEAVSLNRF